jgi:hypothetical protein
MAALDDRVGREVMQLCERIADGLQAAGNCPCCSAVVEFRRAAGRFEVFCPSGCFKFDFLRDHRTGAFVSGLLDLPGQTTISVPHGTASVPVSAAPKSSLSGSQSILGSGSA